MENQWKEYAMKLQAAYEAEAILFADFDCDGKMHVDLMKCISLLNGATTEHIEGTSGGTIGQWRNILHCPIGPKL